MTHGGKRQATVFDAKWEVRQRLQRLVEDGVSPGSDEVATQELVTAIIKLRSWFQDDQEYTDYAGQTLDYRWHFSHCYWLAGLRDSRLPIWHSTLDRLVDEALREHLSPDELRHYESVRAPISGDDRRTNDVSDIQGYLDDAVKYLDVARFLFAVVDHDTLDDMDLDWIEEQLSELDGKAGNFLTEFRGVFGEQA